MPILVAALVLTALGAVALVRLRRAERAYRRAVVENAIVARHRLGNGLTVVRGSASTLLARNLDTETRERLLREILREAERLETAFVPGVVRPEEVGVEPPPPVLAA